MKIQIICTSPGMRRNGIEHPASAFYDPDRWTGAQLEAFRKDPDFVVREVDETAESTMTEADFDLRVDAEVKRLVAIRMEELQAGFDLAVKELVDTKTASLKADHDNTIDELSKQLKAAQDKAADLEKQLAAAAKPAAKAK